MFGRIFISSI